MSAVILLLVSLFINSVSSTLNYFHHPVKSCHIGDVVQNECNRCLCTSKTVFKCTPVDCNKTKIINITESTSQICLPNQLYVQNLITCICTKDGRWPHQSCQETFLALPPSSVVKHKCDPDTNVVIDCNVCRCGPDGEFISTRCTRNICEDDVSRRHHKVTSNKKNSVYSNCETQTWYSLAPCQFCYCVNENKLVCNTGNDQTQKLELGTYDMQVCGTEMIKEALELVPDTQGNLREGIDGNANVAPEPPPETTTDKVIKKKPKKKVTTESINIIKQVAKADSNVKSLAADKEDYYSDTEEEKPAIIVTTSTTAASVSQPAVENVARQAETVEDNDNSNSEEDNSNEIDGDHLTIPGRVDETKKSSSGQRQEEIVRRTKMEKKSAKNTHTLKINLPDMLNKMFSRAIRKSMVSLDVGSQCTPGTTSSDGCNMCFCLKNGKLLCSSQRC